MSVDWSWVLGFASGMCAGFIVTVLANAWRNYRIYRDWHGH